MTCRQLLAKRPDRVTMADITEATGEEGETMAHINMTDAIRGNRDILMYDYYRAVTEDYPAGMMTWVFTWRVAKSAGRLMSARTNLE